MINPFDLRDFGAVGNGVADDTSAVQNAISAASTAGGGVVFLPPGTYLTGQINLAANVELRGFGMGVTTIKLKNANNTHLLRGSSATNCIIRDLTVDGNRANQTGTESWSGIHLITSNYAQVIRCEVKETYRIGITLAGSPYSLIDACYIHNTNYIGCWLGDNGSGTYSQYSTIRNCNVVETGLDSITLASDNLLCSGNYCKHSGNRTTDAGNIYTTPGRRFIRIIGNHVEDGTGFGIDLAPDATYTYYGIVVEGNVCLRSRNSGIQSSVPGVTITGNYCQDNGQNNGQAAPSLPYGIYIAASDVVVTGNVCTDLQGTKTQLYGIRVAAGGARQIIASNILDGNSTGAVLGTQGTDGSFFGNTATGGLTSTFSGVSIGGGATITKVLSNSATYDPPNTTSGNSWVTTIAVAGAVIGNFVIVNHSSITTGGWFLYGYVSSAGTVTVVGVNHTGGTSNLASGTLKVFVFQT